MNCHADYIDSAPLYALGSLETADMHAFRQHLSLGCRRCQSILSVYDNVASLLHWLVRTPPSELSRRRMQRRIRADL